MGVLIHLHLSHTSTAWLPHINRSNRKTLGFIFHSFPPYIYSPVLLLPLYLCLLPRFSLWFFSRRNMSSAITLEALSYLVSIITEFLWRERCVWLVIPDLNIDYSLFTSFVDTYCDFQKEFVLIPLSGNGTLFVAATYCWNLFRNLQLLAWNSLFPERILAHLVLSILLFARTRLLLRSDCTLNTLQSLC